MTTQIMKRVFHGIVNRRTAAAVFVVAGALTVIAYYSLPDYRDAVRKERNRAAIAVVDREGRLLRVMPDSQDRFSLWTDLSQISPHLRNAVIAAEDKRFLHHPGVDPIALCRAVITNIRRGKTVSGASTITQQTVRLIRPRPRTVWAKAVEAMSGLKMERQLTKDEILELYLNLSPMNRGIRGVGLASLCLFEKDVSKITVSEAATLAALPRSPGRYDPRRAEGRKRLLAERDRVLGRMAAQGMIDLDRLKLARASAPTFKDAHFPLEAPHFTDFVLRHAATPSNPIRTTVDLSIQNAVERVVRSHRNRLGRLGIEQAGAMVVSVDDLSILAMVGSFRYGRADQGYNNACLALRGAGSTLKPFLYALALERGWESFSEIPDTFRRYRTPHGDYQPLNADRRSYGPVNVRSALGNSLNISAVRTLRSLGVRDFYDFLARVDLKGPAGASPDHYGLGLAVGNLETSLYALVQSYAALAKGGEYGPLRYLQDDGPAVSRAFNPETAYVISHILSDPSARLLTFGNPDYFDFAFPTALKTGTSSNYRDDWIIGYTPRHVIGIWAGNFSGRANNSVTGARACGPILKEIIHALYGTGYPGAFERPTDVKEASVCWMSGRVASPGCPHTMNEPLIHESSMRFRCDSGHIESQYVYLGAHYAEWLHRREIEQGRSRFRLGGPAGASDDALGETVGETLANASDTPARHRARIRILQPHDGDRFVVSSHRRDRIVFRALPEPLVAHVTWFLNGVEVHKTAPPYEFVWEPVRGRHVVHAVTPSREASEVVIHVE